MSSVELFGVPWVKKLHFFNNTVTFIGLVFFFSCLDDIFDRNIDQLDVRETPR